MGQMEKIWNGRIKQMNKFTDIMQKKIGPFSQKLAGNKVIQIVSGGFNMMMPVIFAGAILSLIGTLNIGNYQQFLSSIGIAPVFNAISTFTTNILGIYAAFVMGYSYMKVENELEHAVSAGLLSVFSFFMMTPITSIEDTSYLAFDYLGTAGLFTAILVGLLSGAVFTVCIRHNVTIKMPKGTPSIVSKSFAGIIPAIFIVIITAVINAICSMAAGVSATELLYGTISKPFESMTGSFPTFLIFLFFCSFFWWFGIHGGQVFMPFIIMIYMANGVANQEAFAAGKPMPYIITVCFYVVIICGGNGSTLGLAIDALFFSKSKRYKELGKLAILPSLCGINEPLIFGMPIVMNPIMAIPFMFVPVINASLAYFLMRIGIVSAPRIAMSALGMPILLDGFLICGVTGIILQIILAAVSTVLYLPFFKYLDNIAYGEETKAKLEDGKE